MYRAAIASASFVVAFLAGMASPSADPGAPTTLTFSLSDTNTMAGYVYGTSAERPTVIMVHGASDTHSVFDFAPGYSIARTLAKQGYGVLTVDRVGYGASSHPNGDTLDYATQAHHLHEVIGQVRGGALGVIPSAVVVLAPSAGADIAIVEAATYRDVDGVVVCFNSSELQPALFAVDVGAWFAQGPYFDFGVEFRTSFFYAEPWAVQRIIDLDNATRSLVPRAEIGSALANVAAPFRSQIVAPVLLMQASNDELFVPRNDSAMFASSTDVTFELLPHAGHKAFSHPTSKDRAVGTVSSWLADRF